MYISCKGITKDGIFCQNVDIELDLSRGLFTFLIVGLADKCIGESKERIMSAIKNSGFDSPKTKNQKIIVSLVPAGIKKEGVLLDLPIAVAYLLANSKIKHQKLKNSVFIGELGLDGSIKPNDSLASVVNLILKNRPSGELIGGHRNNLVNLYSNFRDDQIGLIKKLDLPGIIIHRVKNLKNLFSILEENCLELESNETQSRTMTTTSGLVESNILNGGNNEISHNGNSIDYVDFGQDIKSFEIDRIIGQEKAKRALLISICGKYNMIISGPPGVGKTMLAKSAYQLLPKPHLSEFLEILSIHNKLTRPFRAPHHTSSYASIIGGGTPIIAGEITKAHKGILFLDELPEFNKNILESLRQPLEDRFIQINRSNGTITLPCDTICICAMNLCPCGKSGIPGKECVCIGNKKYLYKQKISEPFLERFHISIALPYEKPGSWNRSLPTNIAENSSTSGREMFETINDFNYIRPSVDFVWNESLLALLNTELEKRLLSMRAINHIKEMSETICLIENIRNNRRVEGVSLSRIIKIKLNVDERHILEALLYKDKLLV